MTLAKFVSSPTSLLSTTQYCSILAQYYSVFLGGIQQLRRQEGVGGWPALNIYDSKVKDLFLFTSFVYKGWLGGQKSPKIYLRNTLNALLDI